jgi:hypothetical protein
MARGVQRLLLAADPICPRVAHAQNAAMQVNNSFLDAIRGDDIKRRDSRYWAASRGAIRSSI